MSTNIERLETVFSRALEFHPDERAAFLAGACGQDAALLQRVRALLQVHEASEGILPERPRAAGDEGPAAERPGDRIGHYKLLERIGEGGCGVVYMAEQEEPVRRRVALKVIKLGMDTKRVVARFEAERQALALMDHPNIARVLDAGATQAGRPFFVMELVKGVKITDYCERNRMPTAQRVELVVQVCRAIQHAHQKGIIHRDIKPSNVLVTVHDGVPVPKVIDFGIAKAIEGRLTEQTLFTSFEQLIGTPAYMSPEQAELKGLDVDTRTDIYSLGVLLYELLIGQTPFDAKELLSAGLDAMRRTIREKEPPRPSTRLTRELARAVPGRQEERESKATARSKDERYALSAEASASKDLPGGEGAKSSLRLLERKELIKALRGDLDWIVMKCLEKDRARRYETANGLAMDLLRHLKGEPVVARPPSRLYRFKKLVQRNRPLFVAVAAAASTLLIGTVGSTWEAIRARRAERSQGRLRAEAERARAGEASQRAAAEQHLYGALLGEARAKQLTRRAGQRFDSLDAIAKAAAIHHSNDLRDAAIAALALPDLREQKSWRFPAHWIAENVCFDDSFKFYAYRTLSGISVRRIEDDHETCVLPIKGLGDIVNGLNLRRFDPRGRYLAASYLINSARPRCRVWDLAHHGDVALDVAAVGNPDFTPDGGAIGIVNPDQSVSVKELESGRDLSRFPTNARINLLRFSPDGKKLAGLELGSTGIPIWDWATGQLLNTVRSPGNLSYLAWNPDGTVLAAGRIDGQIELWDAASGRRLANMEGHEGRVTALAFSHRGDVLASGGWDSMLRLWDVARGRQLLIYQTQDSKLHFGSDDRVLACAVEGETCRLLEVAHSTGLRRLVAQPDTARSWTGDFSGDGRFLAVATGSGINVWDVVNGSYLGRIPTAECRGVRFQPGNGLSLVGSTENGLFRWPLEMEPTAHGSLLRVEVPQILVQDQLFRYLALNRDGTRILASRSYTGEPLLLDTANPTNQLVLPGHPSAEFVTLDPSGRWAATGTWKGADVKVYETATGKLLHTLSAQGTAVVAFSPDGHWLAAADTTSLRLWQTDGWEQSANSVPGDRVSEINPFAFSPDGRLLAAIHATYQIQLLKVPTCEVVATLQLPTASRVASFCFSPDGTRLAACEWSGPVDVWDLRLLRAELRKLDLDWDLPSFSDEENAPPIGPETLHLDTGPFSATELARLVPLRNANASTNLIDLTDYYNAPLTESWHSPREDKNDLSDLTPGVRELGGVEFDIRGLIQIGAGAPNGLTYPNHVLDIPIGRKCRRLHFLHAAILSGNAHSGDELGSYIFFYADGHQVERPIVMGKDMVDWWSLSSQTATNCQIAWTGNNPAASREGHKLRLFKTTWENPFPNVPITQFDFTSDKPTPGQPFLVAVTAEP